MPLPTADDTLRKDIMRFRTPSGADLTTRNDPYLAWQRAREQAGLWPYFRSYATPLTPHATAVSDTGVTTAGPNFGGQDYLSLTGHPEILEAAHKALYTYGPLTAGSPALGGGNPLSKALEAGLAEALRTDHVMLFPTGWASGFGTIRALMHKGDHILLDKLSHDSLRQGAAASGATVEFFRHLDNEAVRRHLAKIRATDTARAVLVVTEGVFSMDSDTPDLAELLALCREFGAQLLVDVAHDFGAMGERGGGQLEAHGILGEVDFVVGAFSKTFASTGGFLATRSSSAREYVRMFGGPQTFSSAITPVQTAVALAALSVVTSEEGARRRTAVRANAVRLRDGLTGRGLEVMGDVVCPVVPVLIGDTATGRTASGLIARAGLIAHLVEQPAVASDAARFRLQVMAEHTAGDIDAAVGILDACIGEARRR
ncbi:aminotransferase class I/II-fold pyridoxal phosphate-dependent enzyme [Streptomyces roseirectus]|uniref:8-amino-7-oxononanoate synthase n=1 Tax=Streptomyces roseirectus TaxID=2768066 RepID=A0A7H0I930_9ACTN|nr:aminotransferase class I/II-fold pyridoxal phosphate-dependent enzyme [Streptomyces roseirectus]QNP69296.1 aminotransferase class I/II-fold pyridoxal phosphate-dependent enzyme [Streptomyces roseirectus]